MPSIQKAKAQRQQAKAQRKPKRLKALTDEQLRQVVGGKKKDPQLVEASEKAAHLPTGQ